MGGHTWESVIMSVGVFVGGGRRGRPGERGRQFESVNYWTLAAYVSYTAKVS